MSQPDQSAPADPLRAPHQPISGYYQTEDERAGFLREIFDSTATDYDKVERTLALGTGPWYRRRALERAGLAPGMRVVDVGFGTGLVAQQAIAVIGDASLLTGVDPSPAMMGASPLAQQVKLVEGKDAVTAHVVLEILEEEVEHEEDLEAILADLGTKIP